ncbi:eukaryotic translation initiation factor 5A-2 [Aspergillus granulosus]|uniref:Eukaryotic translation initiation factor 5A n=1 Tax=Aspergillus granulosus TaxID=176169 RepID=A0ABR4HA23_9EURO
MPSSERELPNTYDRESQTVSVNNSSLRKGGHVVIKGRPCKLVEVTTSQVGKRGNSKIHLIGLDIFTGRNFEDVVVSTAQSDAPIVRRSEYQLVRIDGTGGHLVLKDTDGNTKGDVRLPELETGQAIRDYVRRGNSAMVTVISALGQEEWISARSS